MFKIIAALSLLAAAASALPTQAVLPPAAVLPPKVDVLPPKQTAPVICGFDLVFVLDSSESVTEKNFPYVKSFVMNLLQNIMVKFGTYVGEAGVQVSLVPFNTYANVALYLNQTNTLPGVLSAINALKYTAGLTNTNDALTKVHDDVLTAAKGDRSEFPNLVVLITDGSYTSGSGNPAAMAEKLRTEKDSTILGIGVSGLNGENHGVFYDELLSITANPNLIFNVSSYDGLLPSLSDITKNVLCTLH